MKSKLSIILFLITTTILYSQRDVKVLSSDFNSLIIEYSPQYIDTSIVKINSMEFRKIEIIAGINLNSEDFGSPSIPQRLLNVGVPSEFGNTIEVLSSVYKEISGQIIPIPYIIPDTMSFSYEYKQSAEYFGFKTQDDLVSFGEFGLIRDVATQTLNLSPIKFDASSNKIKIYTKILFKINFTNGIKSNKPADDLLDGVLINYDVAKYWNYQDPNKNLNKVAFANSVLANGKWVKFEASDEGIYKISRASLSSFGIDASTVDPRTIKIYNNSGKVLSENISAPRPQDLLENAIVVFGEDDGRFDEGDYILFYGRGSSFWDYDTDGKTIKRFFHTYSTKNYYWITSGGTNGKRMIDKPGLNITPLLTQTSTAAFADWEVDKINIGQTGRQFVGDNFSGSVTSRTYTNTLNGRINTTPISYNIRFVVGSSTGLTLKLSENGSQIYQQNLAGYSGDYVVGKEYIINTNFSNNLTDNRSVLNFSIVPSAVSATGYLDYFSIKYEKELKAFGDNLMFFSSQTDGVVEYALNGFSSSNIQVYDVTNSSDVKAVTNYSDLTGGECKFKFNESSTIRSKYIAVGNGGFKSPSNPIEVQNSNLRGEQQGAKYLIITHKNFREAANNLKSYKENQAPVTISTYVADIEQIYNEFSCGLVDPSGLRDYIKYAFDNWQIKPQYVLMFGKGTYDYKNVEGYGDNFIPTWQSIESLFLTNSYSSDDYFVRVSGATDLKVDLSLGRITCSSSTEANNMVNKIRDYELNQSKGNWRNLITLIADDGLKSDGTNEGSEHTAPCESLANTYIPKSFNLKKIYSAAYPDVITGQGRRKPLVNQAIIDAINEGTLFLNFIGHGSPELWTHEVIFEKSITLPQLKNDKYFFLCAATCDFGYWDIPNYQSAAEAIVFLPKSGAIAGFSATRLVYSGENHNLNYHFANNMFKSQRDTLNLNIPIGKVSFLTKQEDTSVNDQKYNILGDPTLRLQVPQYAAVIDSINGMPLTSNVQIKALSKTKVDGHITKPDNSLWTDFNGEGILTFYDSQRKVYLSAISYDVNMPGGVIFNGRISITNGKFSSEFVVPKDISYENKNGKIVLYFQNNSVDGLGYTEQVIVGGTDNSLINDQEGPEMEVSFDDLEFNNGYLITPNSNLIVKLSDQTGLNTTGTGVGHKLEGVLNKQINNPLDFTNYFTGDLDSGGKSGKINYRFSNLENGEYQILVKAWDVFNNPTEQTSFFSVVDGNDLVINDIYNYPNPFSEKTQFTFQRNLSKPIDVKIKIYSIAGRLLKEIESLNIYEKFVVVDWDGRDADGDKLANGTYLYKIIVKSVDGEFNKSVIGKLAVIK